VHRRRGGARTTSYPVSERGDPTRGRGAAQVREHAEIVVIGGGQAGLCTSFFLARYGQEHVVLEQGRVAETWRTQRWESFTLNTPNWTLQLPGHGYAGDGPDAFMPRDDVVSYLERYAEVIDAPLRPGVRVASLERTSDGYLLETSEGPLEADTVVVATGAFQRPRAPAIAGDRDPRILQLHTSDYRSPDQLPAGAVLVIGRGQSGCHRRGVGAAGTRRVPLRGALPVGAAPLSRARSRPLDDRPRTDGRDRRHAPGSRRQARMQSVADRRRRRPRLPSANARAAGRRACRPRRGGQARQDPYRAGPGDESRQGR